MGIDLFKSIADAMKMHDSFLKQRRNCAKDLGHSTYQKVTAALRKMAYGIPGDLVDDNLAMGKSQAINCVKRFALVVVKVFGCRVLESTQFSRHAKTSADQCRLWVSRYVIRLKCIYNFSCSMLVFTPFA
jgi:hypothetical protein